MEVRCVQFKLPRRATECNILCRWKMLCLRGAVEHRKLSLSQLRQFTDPERYVYVENVSKTRLEMAHSSICI